MAASDKKKKESTEKTDAAVLRDFLDGICATHACKMDDVGVFVPESEGI